MKRDDDKTFAHFFHLFWSQKCSFWDKDSVDGDDQHL